MGVVDNPLLGPTWESVAQVLLRLVEDVRRGDIFGPSDDEFGNQIIY